MFILRRYLRTGLAGIKWNGRPTSNGISGRNHVESVADFKWNQWPAWTGIRMFMENAEQGLVGVYSAGDELEKVAAEASREKRYVDAFLYDLIGLAVLRKTRQQIDKIVE